MLYPLRGGNPGRFLWIHADAGFALFWQIISMLQPLQFIWVSRLCDYLNFMIRIIKKKMKDMKEIWEIWRILPDSDRLFLTRSNIALCTLTQVYVLSGVVTLLLYSRLPCSKECNPCIAGWDFSRVIAINTVNIYSPLISPFSTAMRMPPQESRISSQRILWTTPA